MNNKYNNINDINRVNIEYKNQNPSQEGIAMSSEINDNLNSIQIDEEIKLRNDKFIVEDEKFNKGIGINNVTIDTIPMYEERSVGDTSFGGDINEILLKGMTTKKKSTTEETITEELNLSSSRNLKKLNLLGNQDSLNNININNMMLQTQKLSQPFSKPPYNFSLTPNKNKFNLQNYNQQLELNSKYNNDSSMTNTEDINSINIYGINNGNNENNIDKQPNDNNNKIHQIRTVYDKIQLKLKNNSNDKDKKEKNNNIINNISNNIIIINDDTINNINIITDNSSSQSQDNIFRNTGLFGGNQFTLLSNEINKNNNFNNDYNKTKQVNFLGKSNNIQMNNILSKNKNNANTNMGGIFSKIGMTKYAHTRYNTDDFNEEKKFKKSENNNDNAEKHSIKINTKKNPSIEFDKK